VTERGARRYRFHGLSYEYIARARPGVSPDAAFVRMARLAAPLRKMADRCLTEDAGFERDGDAVALPGLYIDLPP
jgi:hypothetical protein